MLVTRDTGILSGISSSDSHEYAKMNLEHEANCLGASLQFPL
jgi:hypothetical protein